MTMTGKWRSCSLTELKWRCWGDDVVVFHATSGDTHRLSLAGFELLKMLSTEPMTQPEMVDRMAQVTGLDSRGELADFVKVFVRRFDELGLIEPFPNCEAG